MENAKCCQFNDLIATSFYESKMVTFGRKISVFKPPFKVEDRFKLTELKLICLDIFRLVNVVRQFLHSGTNGLFIFHLTARPSGSYLQHFGTLLSR